MDTVPGKVSRCKDACSCSCGEGKGNCSAEQCPGNNLVYIKPLNKESCEHQMNFGKYCICTCPKRNELYHDH